MVIEPKSPSLEAAGFVSETAPSPEARLPSAPPPPRARELLLLALVAMLLLPRATFLGEVLFERDVQLVWHPQVEAFVEAVREGSWPLWDPHVAFGHPMLANPNTQVLYPLTWANLLLPAHAFYTLYALAHLLLAGAGARALGTQMGLSRRGALLAGVSYMASGPVVSLVSVWHHLGGAAWIPWVLWSADRALLRPSLSRALVWGIFGALQFLAGSPDMSLFTLLLGLGHLAWRTHRASSPKPVAMAALAAVMALGLTTALWLPAVEALRGSSRQAFGLGERAGWAVAPLGLLQLLSPVAWTRLPVGGAIRAHLFDGGHPFVWSLYLGLPVLVFAGLALRRRTRTVVVLGAAALGALAYALGPATPFYSLLVTILAPLQWVRYPSKAMVIVSLCAGLLCGLGVDSGLDRARRALPWLVFSLAAMMAVVALGAWCFPTLAGRLLAVAPGMPMELLRQSLLPIVLKLGLGAAIVAALAASTLGLGAGRLALVLVAVDLVWAHHDLNQTTEARFFRFRPPFLQDLRPAPEARVLVHRYPMLDAEPLLRGRNAYRVARQPEGMAFDAARALSVRLYMLPPLAASFGFRGSFDEDLLGLYPPQLRRLVDLYSAASDPEERLRLLQAGGVEHVVALHRSGFEPLTPLGSYESLLAEPILTYRVPSPLPHAYCTTGVRVASPEESGRVLVSQGFDPRQEVLLTEGEARSATGAGVCSLTSRSSDRLEAEVDLSSPGHLVILDTFAPGWRASVDGQPAPVLPANLAFRAVPVPAGRHRVELAYRPASILTGASVSACTLILAAVLFALERARARRASGPSATT